MAIKIPSKNIYEMNNPKIRDNVIDNVSVEQTIVKPNNEYETNVYNEAIYEVPNKIGTPKNYQALVTEKMGMGNDTVYRLKFRHLDLNYAFLSNYSFQIPRIKNNSYIEKVLVGLNKDGAENIKHTVYYDYQEIELEGTLTYTISKDSGGTATANVVSLSFNEVGNLIEQTTGSGKIPKEYKYTFEYPTGAGSSVTETLEVDNESNLDKEDIYTSTEQYFNFNISLLTQSSFDILQHYTILDAYDISSTLTTKTATVSGKRIKYIPKKVEITIYGDTIGIDLTDGSILCGSGTKPHSLSGNELLQDSATRNSLQLATVLGSDILTQYEKGKETATLLCSISDYYDYETNELLISDKKLIETPNVTYSIDMVDIGVGYRYNYYITFDIGKTYNEDVEIDYTYIFTKKENIENTYSRNDKITIRKGQKSTSKHILESEYEYNFSVDTNAITQASLPMIFENHSQVIPYVFGADGQDKPMSKYQDGSPKVFEVVGSNIIYDGAVWQELTLLEKQKTNS